MLERHSGINTSNTDVVRAALFDNLGATHFDLPNRRDAFSLGLHWYQQKELTLVSSVCNQAADVEYAPATFVRQYFEMSRTCRFRFSFGRETAELSENSSSVIVPSDTTLRVESSASHNLLVLRVDQNALNRKAQTMLGVDAPCHVRFEKPSQGNNPKQQSMRQAVIQFAGELDLLVPTLSVAHAELEQAMIIRFLLCNNHNFSAKFEVTPPSVSTSQIQLVEDFIEANWEKPLEIESLAKISNISTRSLFRNFMKARGTSPFQHLKNVRLSHARRLLQAGSENTTVVSVALKCGFQSLGHFARDYREAFGELPSKTMRRASPPSKHRLSSNSI